VGQREFLEPSGRDLKPANRLVSDHEEVPAVRRCRIEHLEDDNRSRSSEASSDHRAASNASSDPLGNNGDDFHDVSRLSVVHAKTRPWSGCTTACIHRAEDVRLISDQSNSPPLKNNGAKLSPRTWEQEAR